MANDLAIVEGLEEVNQMLTDLPRVIVARAWFRALQAGAKVMEKYLIERTPEWDDADRDEGIPHLIDSTVIEINLDTGLRGGIASVGFGKVGHVAYWVEYGHELIGHKPDKKFLKVISPQPFMRQAISAAYEATIDAFQAALVQVLTSEVPGFDVTFAESGGSVTWFDS